MPCFCISVIFFQICFMFEGLSSVLCIMLIFPTISFLTVESAVPKFRTDISVQYSFRIFFCFYMKLPCSDKSLLLYVSLISMRHGLKNVTCIVPWEIWEICTTNHLFHKSRNKQKYYHYFMQ